MSFKRRIALLPVALLGSLAALTENSPAQAPLEAGASALPNETFFKAPSINPTLAELRAGAAPTSSVDGLAVGAPAPVFRTLREAAAAGINPAAEKKLVVTRNPETDVSPSRPVWPIALAGAALLAAAFIALVAVMLHRWHRSAAEIARRT